MSESKDQAQTIFLSALELATEGQRAAFIEARCGADSELRQEVEELLDHARRLGPFLGLDDVARNETIAHEIAERPGTIIGPYKLLQQIGEGGMGVVFMAEQSHPIQRTVALKIIKPGMDTRQVIARFEAERQALAMMDHPNIAKVLDAGTTETGRPYFVMELVKGVPITKYCDDHQFTLRQRLELLLPVCQAVQHAHQKGIIHRDLKPTNVLVAEYDNHAVPKVIDFGVAKATAQKLTERTMFTEFGQVIGTVEYMSPEQAKFNQLDIDTRSDIYSLGVLLYELLTGSTPFERERLRSAAFDEVLRIIREEEPPRPSTRLGTSPTLPSIAASRHSEPARLSREVRGELDWIVMKCLEKERSRRYETANGLARDLERFLNDEAVQACPPSAVYRFRKFANRNKAGFAASTAALLALLMAVVGLAISNHIIATERNQKAEALAKAEAERQRAETNFVRMRVAARSILTQAAMGLNEWSRLTPSLRRKFSQEAINLYENFLQPESTDPSLQHETGVAYRVLSDLHRTMGELPQAEAHIRKSIAILDRISSQHPEVAPYQQQLANSHYVLGNLMRRTDRSAEAEEAMQRAVTLYEKLVPETVNSAEYLFELSGCYGVLARLQTNRGATQQADSTVKRLLELPTKLSSDSSELWQLHWRVASDLGIAGRLEEAIACRDKVTKLKPTHVEAYIQLGAANLEASKLDEAKAAWKKAIDLRPNSASLNNRVAWYLVSSSNPSQRDAQAAIEFASKAIDLAANDGDIWNTLGVARYAAGQWQESIDVLEKSTDLKGGGDAYNWYFMAMAHWQLDHKDEARKWYNRAVVWHEKNQPDDKELRRFRNDAAKLLDLPESPKP